jgi:hypothetical protein
MRQRLNASPRFLSWLGALVLCATGCGTDGGPTAPTPSAPFGGRFTTVDIGDVIRTEVTAADVACDFGFYCKYFVLAAPRAGTLEIGLTHAPGALYGPPSSTPIDMWVGKATGGGLVWMDVHRPDVEAYARIPASAGETYQVGVVSYEMPGVSFQLRFLLRP